MEFTNLSILIFFLILTPAVIGIYMTVIKNKKMKWAIIGVAITLFLLIFKPVKLDSGASPFVQQSFSTQRETPPEFNPSVDQRYHSNQKDQQLKNAQSQFNQRQGN